MLPIDTRRVSVKEYENIKQQMKEGNYEWDGRRILSSAGAMHLTSNPESPSR